MYYKSMGKLEKHTKVKVLRITEIQDSTLKKLRKYNVNVSQFIRDAISEKLQRDHKALVSKPKPPVCPF